MASADLKALPILYSGSVKNVRQKSNVDGAPESLVFEFTDQVSVFDWGALPDLIPHKGKALAKIGSVFFEALSNPQHWHDWFHGSGSIGWIEQITDPKARVVIESVLKKGLRSHFISAFSDRSIEVSKLQVHRPSWIDLGSDRETPVYPKKIEVPALIPLEVIFRFELVKGSSLLSRRPDLSVGHRFHRPFVEFFTKLESQDRSLSRSEALAISGLSAEQFQEMELRTELVASFLQFTFSRLSPQTGGIELIDGKFEWGLDSTGQLILVDSIGPDELRLLRDGKDLSKESLREFYRTTEWFADLNRAKKSAIADGVSDWKSRVMLKPPAMPSGLIQSVSTIYDELATDLQNLFSKPATFETVLLVGSGGREHALAEKILSSPQVNHLIWVSNQLLSFEKTVRRFPKKKLTRWDDQDLAKRAKEEKVTLTVIGPDAYLAAGLADEMIQVGILTFGPTREAAKLEWSKQFSKMIMTAAGAPTARYFECESIQAAQDCVQDRDWTQRWVIKVDALAAGKGVEICGTLNDALLAIERLSRYGSRFVIEEFLQGKEVSVFAFCDGSDVSLFEPVRDFKTLNEDQKGPNTGGMGAISPVTDLNPDVLKTVRERLFLPVLREMQKRNTPYRGLLYAGLMVQGNQYWNLEFNARFGDPEAQVVLPRMKGDLVAWLKACASGSLATFPAIVPAVPQTAVYVVATVEGYPDSPKLGQNIEGLNADFEVTSTSNQFQGYISGVEWKAGEAKTAGGRVFGALGMHADPTIATVLAHQRLKKIRFEGMHSRVDVGVPNPKVAILASGRGSNAEAILNAIQEKKLLARVEMLICNRPNAGVLKIAEQFSLTHHVVKTEAEVQKHLIGAGIEYVILAGYDRILSLQFIDAFRDPTTQHSRVINIHPALLPSFKGLGGYRLAFDAKVKLAGVTVHRVEPELDAGPILAQEAFSIDDLTTVEAVEKRGLEVEHRLYAATLKKLFLGVQV